MYPVSETYDELVANSFYDALTDANMLVPTGNADPTQLLFDPNLFQIQMEGSASEVGSIQQVTFPLQKSIFSIGRAYGPEFGYLGDNYKDVDAWLRVRVITNSGATSDDIEARFQFARDHRRNVFSYHGLVPHAGSLIGVTVVDPSPVTGTQAIDYRLRFWASRAG